MKTGFGKRIISVLLSLCIVISLFSGVVQKQSIEANAGAIGTFAFNQLLTRGMQACAFALSCIAEEANNDGFSQAVAGVNRWVFGVTSNDNSAQFAALAKRMDMLCADIMEEMGVIETGINTLQSAVNKIGESQAYNEYLEAWDADVDQRISVDMHGVISSYRLFMQYAHSYASQESKVTVNGTEQIATEHMVMLRKLSFLSELANVAGIPVGLQPAFSSTDDLDQLKSVEQAYYALLFDSTEFTPVDDEMRSTVNNLMIPLVTDSKGNRFIDRASQVAYYYFPYSDQQADFVDAAVRRQAAEIYTTLMIYQEFLSMRQDYYTQSGKIEDPVYQQLLKNCASSLQNQLDGTQGGYENGVAGRLVEWLDQPVYITNKSYLYLTTYMRSADVTDVTLRNTSFVQERDYAFYLAEAQAMRVANTIDSVFHLSFGSLSQYKSRMATTAEITSEYMTYFRRGIVVVPESGEAKVQPIYILQDGSSDKANSRMSKLNVVKKNNAQIIGDIPTADYYNLAQGTYSDGVNTFVAPSNVNFLKALFNNSYLQSCDRMYDYMAQDLGYPISTNTSVYMLTANPTSSVYAGYGTTYSFLNMSQKIETWELNQTEYNEAAGGTSLMNSMFVSMLTNSSDAIYSTVNTKVVGSGSASVAVSGLDEDGKTVSGTMTNITITADPHTAITSVDVQYHEDASNPAAVSRTQKLVADGSLLQFDENGVAVLDYQVPYSNVTIVVNTEMSHKFNDVGLCDVCGIYEPAYVGGQYGEIYEIAKPGQLYWFAALVNGDWDNAEFANQITNAYGKIVKPLDMSKIKNEWRPIGMGTSNAFNGIFDGNFQLITNLDGMLFGTVDTGVLQKIAIESGYFYENENYARNRNGRATTGSIVGIMLDSDMRLCYSNAVSCAEDAEDVGGLVGVLYQSTMTDCYFAGTIGKIGGVYTGGLVGRAYSLCDIENCHVYAYVIGGGLVGYSDVNENTSWITNSYYNMAMCEYFYVDNALVSLENPCDMPDSDFTCGKVTYLLNADREETVWGQRLGTQKYPVLNGPKVYFDNDKYSNDFPCEHDWADATCTEPKTCKICGDTQGEPLGHVPVIEYYNGYNVVRCDRCGEVLKVTDQNFKLRGAYLTLAADISIIYRATIPAGFENAYLVFTVNGVEYTAYSMGKNAAGEDLFTYPGINPQMMGDNISATLYATVDDMQVTYTHANYSVVTYLDRLLDKGVEEDMFTLISDLLVYGAASQVHVDYKLDALVTDLITHEIAPSTFPGVDVITNRFALNGEETANDVTSAGINLSNRVVMRLGFTITDSDRSKYTVKIVMSDKEYTYSASDLYYSDGKYWLNFSEYYACQFDSLATVCLMEGQTQVSRTLTYSVNSYIARNADADGDYAQLLQAVYNYGATAKEYVLGMINENN